METTASYNQEIQAAIVRKREALQYLVKVTSRHKTHMGRIKWTEGGRRMYAQLSAEIRALETRLNGGVA